MMKVNSKTFQEVHEPMYILEENLLRRNLQLIHSIADSADVEIILALKAYALWKTFPIFREYIPATTASSLNEARLAFEEFGCPVHTYTPAYTEEMIDEIAGYSSHLVFNSGHSMPVIMNGSPVRILGLALASGSTPSIQRLKRPCIILVLQDQGLEFWLDNYRISYLRILKVFMCIVIVRVVLIPFSGPLLILKINLANGFLSWNGLISVEGIW
jgi:hypothetical protein